MLAVHTIELGEIPVYGTFDGCHSWREPMLVNFFSQWFTALNLLPSSATEATLRRFRLRRARRSHRYGWPSGIRHCVAGHAVTRRVACNDVCSDSKPVELTSDQIADVLERIERRSRHSAHRARCAIGSTYRWALRRSKLRRNPIVGLGFTVRPIPRERVLSDDEWQKLWRGIDTVSGMAEPMRIILLIEVRLFLFCHGCHEILDQIGRRLASPTSMAKA